MKPWVTSRKVIVSPYTVPALTTTPVVAARAAAIGVAADVPPTMIHRFVIRLRGVNTTDRPDATDASSDKSGVARAGTTGQVRAGSCVTNVC